jgi:L,D-peptidoglycan transpeptidase YkuD (ErfK/YbiS/YcfS/YnhG family)
MSIAAPGRQPHIVVRVLRATAQSGLLVCGHLRLRCAVGRSGVRASKREGDGATPRGRFALGAVLYNPSTGRRPVTPLPVRVIGKSDGWCDAAADRNYNRPVHLPYAASAERLWRDDGLYDLVVVVDYNIRPRRRGLGSAIFLHVAQPGLQPTEGCVALPRRDLVRLLQIIGPRTRLVTSR